MKLGYDIRKYPGKEKNHNRKLSESVPGQISRRSSSYGEAAVLSDVPGRWRPTIAHSGQHSGVQDCGLILMDWLHE
jgi:hypothetical protein